MDNLLIKNACELITSKGDGVNPKRGKDMSDIGMIKNGAIVVENGIIKAVGRTESILKEYDESDFDTVIDAKEKAVLPGFVDSHTHFIFGGYRAEEFSWRLKGESYMDIHQKGGGIANTVEATRNTSVEEFVEIGRKRLKSMERFGVTTVEGKSGYGLDLDTEIRMLESMKILDKEEDVDVVSTYLGPHSVLSEWKGKETEFIDFCTEKVLPVVKEKDLAEFADIFCEKNVFSVEDSRRFLTRAGELGFKLKIHADEIYQLGGSELAGELHATSADHLLKASDAGIKAMADNGVISTILPLTAFSLNEEYARARYMIDNGCAVALASDLNPGSCFSNSIPLMIAVSAINMHMSIEEIITALTYNGACAVARQDSVGSLEVGKKADIIILEYPSINFLPYHAGCNIVETVIKDGKIKIFKNWN